MWAFRQRRQDPAQHAGRDCCAIQYEESHRGGSPSTGSAVPLPFPRRPSAGALKALCDKTVASLAKADGLAAKLEPKRSPVTALRTGLNDLMCQTRRKSQRGCPGVAPSYLRPADLLPNKGHHEGASDANSPSPPLNARQRLLASEQFR